MKPLLVLLLLCCSCTKPIVEEAILVFGVGNSGHANAAQQVAIFLASTSLRERAAKLDPESWANVSEIVVRPHKTAPTIEVRIAARHLGASSQAAHLYLEVVSQFYAKAHPKQNVVLLTGPTVASLR